MWGGFPKVIKEVFPNASITIDRFHVMQLVNKALNKIRLNLGLKGLKNKLILMRNGQDLEQEKQSELEQLLNSSPSLRIAYQLKEELRSIYEQKLTVKGGLRLIETWLNSARIFFPKAASTLANHLPEIANYFMSRTTSAVTEGINTKIKLILRQSYGFKNFDLMREKLLACLFK